MRNLTKVLGAALLWMGSAAGAEAAPQILGVVPLADPVTLHCAAGTCQAEISTLCLQEHREKPRAGELYRPAAPSVFGVIAKTATGKIERVALPAATFRVTRGRTASEVAFDPAALARPGLTPVALTVTRGTLLIPRAGAGGGAPVTGAEIAEAQDRLWPVARRVMQAQDQTVAAIGVLNRLLNATPPAGPMKTAARQSLWQGLYGPPPAAGSAGALASAHAAYAGCQDNVSRGVTFTLRECLATRVDALLTDLNVAYWKAARGQGE